MNVLRVGSENPALKPHDSCFYAGPVGEQHISRRSLTTRPEVLLLWEWWPQAATLSPSGSSLLPAHSGAGRPRPLSHRTLPTSLTGWYGHVGCSSRPQVSSPESPGREETGLGLQGPRFSCTYTNCTFACPAERPPEPCLKPRRESGVFSHRHRVRYPSEPGDSRPQAHHHPHLSFPTH